MTQMNKYPKRDITPEHTKRGSEGGEHKNDKPLNAEIIAAYAYIDSVLDTSDYKPVFAWHGWALREAFLAGISHNQREVK